MMPCCSSGGGSTAHMRSGGVGGGRAGSERERATRAGAHTRRHALASARVSERRRRRGGAERRDARRERAWRRRARRRSAADATPRVHERGATTHTRAAPRAAQGGRRTESVESTLAPSSSSLRASSTLPSLAALRAFPFAAIARDACGTGGDARRAVSALGGARRSLAAVEGRAAERDARPQPGCSLKRSHGAPARGGASSDAVASGRRHDLRRAAAARRASATRGSQSPVWLGEAERRRRLRGRCSRGAQHWTALRRAARRHVR